MEKRNTRKRNGDGSLNDPMKIDDQRVDLPIFIHRELDDMSLSLEAFRVYAHLARRAGRDNDAWPSYNSIGEHCFRASYPKAKPDTLRRKAIAAVKELVDHKLIIKVINKDESGDHKSNHYALTSRDCWGGSVNTLGSVNALGGSVNTLGSVNAPKGTPIEDTPIPKASWPPAENDDLPEAYHWFTGIFLYPPLSFHGKPGHREKVLRQLEEMERRYSKEQVVKVFELVRDREAAMIFEGNGRIGDKLSYATKILAEEVTPKPKRVRAMVKLNDPFTGEVLESVEEMTVEQAAKQKLQIVEYV